MPERYFVHSDMGSIQDYAFYPSYADAVNATGEQIFLLIPDHCHLEVDLTRSSVKTFRIGNPSSVIWTIIQTKIPATKKYLLHTWNDKHQHNFEFFNTLPQVQTATKEKPANLHQKITDTRDIPVKEYIPVSVNS